jgi:hypothetical protein
MFYWKNNLQAHLKTVVVLGALVLLAACKDSRNDFVFYPVDSLVTAQINALTVRKASLHKEALLGTQVNSLKYTPKDTLTWINELDVFRQLETMNKLVNRDSYIVDDGLYDPGSNLTVKAFTAKEETDLPVNYLRVFYHESVNNPRKIEALYNENNTLYKSSRLLIMEFEQIQDTTLLTSYSIHGGQKMTLGDSIIFAISGKIQIK